jgi:anti-sigma regulatory factor (Ser/Thr protein kinase)
VEMWMDGAVEKFEPRPHAVVEVRAFVRRALRDLGMSDGDGALVDDLVLSTNELACNAVLHARTDFTVRVTVERSRVRIEVTDENTRPPQPYAAPVDATSGRGLSLVEAMGLSWGVTGRTGGKTVWIEGERQAGSAPG